MALRGEFEFYAAGSGLPAGSSLAEHKRAYWAAQGPVASPQTMSFGELEAAYYRAELGDDQTWETLDGLRYRYFAGLSGLGAGNSINDHMVAVFAGGGPAPSAGYGLMPYGLGPYGL